MHAIETLHQMIEDGEIMRRRAATGAGANVARQEIPSSGQPIAGPAREQVSMADADAETDGDRRPTSAEPDRAARLPVAVERAARSSSTRREQYVDVVKALRRRRLRDVRRPHRRRLPRLPAAAPLPDGVDAERFEVVVNLLDMARRRRIRLRVQVPNPTPRCRRCSTSIPAPRRWSARCSTCSASPSTATPT